MSAHDSACPAVVAEGMLCLLLLQVHLVRRLYETRINMSAAKEGRMHLAAYLFSFVYYSALVSSFYIHSLDPTPKAELSMLPWGIMGIVTFIAGSREQFLHHKLLAVIRHQSDTYTIPTGRWFHYVSAPHYLAEMMIYLSFVMISRFSAVLPLVIFSWVVINLSFSAFHQHHWYLEKFENYPRQRYAVIPLVL